MSAQETIWAMFERDFTKTFPGAVCAKFDVTFITKDGERASIAITRNGYEEELAEFEGDE